MRGFEYAGFSRTAYADFGVAARSSMSRKPGLFGSDFRRMGLEKQRGSVPIKLPQGVKNEVPPVSVGKIRKVTTPYVRLVANPQHSHFRGISG